MIIKLNSSVLKQALFRTKSLRHFTISGPEYPNIVKNESLGKYFVDCLKQRKSQEAAYIDAASGAAQTCGKLLENVVKAVRVFKDLDLKHDDVICVISENTIRYHVPVIAAFCMGVIANLLNPNYTLGELRHAILLSRPKVIICSCTTHKNILSLRNELDFLQTVLLTDSGDKTGNDATIMQLENLIDGMDSVDVVGFVPGSFDAAEQGAVILQTSGTSGTAKGILITHQNLSHALLSYVGGEHGLCFGRSDTIALILPFFHIFGLIVSFSAICFETKVVVQQQFKRDLFFKTIERYKVTKLQAVPHLLRIFVDDDDLKKYDLSSIKEIAVGGAYVCNHEIAEASKRFPNVNFKEVYGTSETCGASTCLTSFPKRQNCVGSLLPNVSAQIRDVASGNALGCMEVGEICFKGPAVMKRYVGTTSDVPFGDDGFYRSGDLGYYDENALLYLVGRSKEVFKYKGFQVSPVEIESLLLTHPDVQESAVIGIPEKNVGEVPLAFVVRKEGRSVSTRELVDFVAERISAHKRLNGGVRFVDELPKTSTGKIIKWKLKKLL